MSDPIQHGVAEVFASLGKANQRAHIARVVRECREFILGNGVSNWFARYYDAKNYAHNKLERAKAGCKS